MNIYVAIFIGFLLGVSIAYIVLKRRIDETAKQLDNLITLIRSLK